jgi:hypothetical protein
MAESGFTHFIRYMQERNAPPKAKRAGLLRGSNKPPENREMQAVCDGLSEPLTSNLSLPSSLNEDYTGSVCLLHKLTRKTPNYEEVLIDIEDFDTLHLQSWRIDRWSRNKEKYCVSTKCIQLAVFVINPPAGKVAEHKSRRTLDNRRSNLRVATQRQNIINTRRAKGGTSQFKGVHLCPKTGKWRVQCGPRNNRVFLGSFASEIEAARAYNEWAGAAYGEFACLNSV